MATPWFVLEQFNTQGIFRTQRNSKVEFLCKIIVETRLGLNMLVILSSNVIWHAYRSMSENKIFRLDVPLICPLYGGMHWQKVVLQKDKTYYFKYREIEGIFTIDTHIVILYRSTLNRNLLYMYILSYF